jgi:hypothetical protein
VREIIKSKTKYFESALRDAQAEGLIHVADILAQAQALFAYVDGVVDAALNSAKKAGIGAGERAERGDRPRGLSEVRVLSFLKRAEPPDLRFFLRAFREADPDFGEEKDPDAGDDLMSREWLIRTMR